MTTASLVKTELLSHGTLECNDTPATRRFLTEFLGIDVIRPLPEAQYLSKGGAWTVVCVKVDGEQKEQGPQNRFKLAVGSAAEVDAAHAAAETHKDSYGIRQVEAARWAMTHVTGGGTAGLDHGACTVHLFEAA